ncbi:MAG: hypothetical protein M1510_01050 [Nitrospirae bacterium]|nr:hypothetical protein [Nitrospirota bacterium]MCL5237487.1 hypothetical protein [Nitrospirota bacterium]
MTVTGKVLIISFVFTFLFPLASFAGRLSEPEELDRTISKINERQSKNLKVFEKKTKAYFFESQKPEAIESLLKEFRPGEAITVLVLSNLSRKPYKEIAAMKKSGKGWQDIAEKSGVKLKNVVKEVKDFRLGIG